MYVPLPDEVMARPFAEARVLIEVDNMTKKQLVDFLFNAELVKYKSDAQKQDKETLLRVVSQHRLKTEVDVLSDAEVLERYRSSPGYKYIKESRERALRLMQQHGRLET